ncbi:MAG: signal peptidase II [Ignavibacteriales bacterium]|nr:MAG: signal peptidase II [Ignavibacteriales bacterium]
MKVLYLSFFVVLIDQVSKLLVKGFSIPFLNINYPGMYHGQRVPVLDDFFRLTFIENPGMAFGFDPGLDLKFYVSLFSLIASIGLIIYIYVVRKQKLSLRIALAFILGGAVGNLIDRVFYGVFYNYAGLFYGRVVDFLDFDFFDVNFLGRSYERWPIFNIADAAVTIGVLILIIFYKHHNKTVEESEPAVESATGEIINESTTSSQLVEEIVDSKNDLTEKNDSANDQPDKGKEIPL